MNLNTLKRPDILLMVMAAAVPLSFSVWMTLIDNFSINQAGFTGREIGILQSLREIPGFMAFAVVFLLFLIKEPSTRVFFFIIAWHRHYFNGLVSLGYWFVSHHGVDVDWLSLL